MKLKWKILFSVLIVISAVLAIWHVNLGGSDFLTNEERVWLEENYRSITVATDPRWHPSQLIDEQQIYYGIASDFMRAVEKELGVRFLRLQAESWDQVLKLESEGKVDIHPIVFQSPERTASWLFTEAYMRIPVIAVMRASLKEKFTPDAIWGLRMSVGHGYGIEDFLRQHSDQDVALIPVESDRFGLIKASLGEIDVMITDLASASYYIEQEGLTNLRLAATLGSLYEFRFASRRDLPILHRILNKALQQVSREERRRIYDRWVVFDVRPFYQSSNFWYVASLSLLFVLLVFAVILVWNAALKLEVRRKTAALLDIQKDLEKRVQRRAEQLASANKALETEMRERAKIARDLLHVSGNERARIGRDLHDSIGQKLVGILYLMRVLVAELEENDRGEAQAAGKVISVVEETICEMKQIVRGLLPVDLLKKGFLDALSALVKEAGTFKEVECMLTLENEEVWDSMDNALATNLYRIAQEAIGNALKHAEGVHRIRVELKMDHGEGLLRIENDGSSMESNDRSMLGTGMGLKIMKYRAVLAGGTLAVHGRDGGGTVVSCHFDPEQIVDSDADGL